MLSSPWRSSSRLQPASTRVNKTNRTTDTPCSPCSLRASSGGDKQPVSQPEIDLVHHQIDRPTSYGDFDHGSSRLLSRPESKLTCSSLVVYTRRTSLPHWRRGDTARDRCESSFRSIANRILAKPEKHKLCLLLFQHTPTTTPIHTTLVPH